MSKNLSKFTLLASLLALLLANIVPFLRAQDSPASAPQPPDSGRAPAAGAGNDSAAGDSGAAGKPVAKKKKRKRKKTRKAAGDGDTAPAPDDGASRGPAGELSSGTTPAK